MRLFGLLTKSLFFRNVAIVATGTAGAQAISMICSPIITRLYGPEAFGLLGAFIAISLILTPMAALAYPVAIVLPRENSEAKGIAQLSILVALGVSSVALLIILLWGGQIAEALNISGIGQYLWIIPFSMMFTAVHQVCEQWLIRFKEFKTIAQVTLIHSVTINGLKVVGGLWYPFAVFLIVAQAISNSIYTIYMYLYIRKRNDRVIGNQLDFGLLARKYLDFPIFRAPEMTINAISQALPVLMLAALFGPAYAGFYSLAYMIMGAPSTLIGKSVGDVFYSRISEAFNREECVYHLVKNTTLLLIVIGIWPFAVVMLWGPYLFGLVFGSEWIDAGRYAQWIAVWMFFGFINISSVKVLPIIKQQAFHLTFTLLSTAFRILALYFSYYFYNSDLISVIAFSSVGVILNIYFLLIVLHRCKNL